MTYAAGQDPHRYPDTTVLRNKLGLRSQEALDEFELALFLIRADEPLPEGSLDFAHYRAIHRHLFQDVYDWAGEIRSIRIGKAGNWFAYPEYIEAQMARIFGELAAEEQLRNLAPADFARRPAHYLSEINAVHPFREGNGRTQLAFLALLAHGARLPFDAEKLEPAQVLAAMIAGFNGEEAPLVALIESLVS